MKFKQISLKDSETSGSGTTLVTAPVGTKLITTYMVIAPNGDGDNVQYNRYRDMCASLYDDSFLSKIFDVEMIQDSVDVSDADDVSDWLMDNAERIAKANGYRVITKQEWEKKS